MNYVVSYLRELASQDAGSRFWYAIVEYPAPRAVEHGGLCTHLAIRCTDFSKTNEDIKEQIQWRCNEEGETYGWSTDRREKDPNLQAFSPADPGSRFITIVPLSKVH
jgi:hypothetical protein